MSTKDRFCVDNEFFRVYNRIKRKKGELTMTRYYSFVLNHKSANPMHWQGVGLTLSYSFFA